MTKRLLAFAALGGWCVALILLRHERTGTGFYFFLIWNLFLAAVPFGASLILEALHKLRVWTVLQWACFVVWLLFLPNAPYIVTDLLHLKPRHGVPLWYDVLLLISAAGTGLLLGYSSMLIVQRVIAKRYGVFTSWVVAVVSLVLSAFGIYLGRFLRFNSWEVISEPLPLFAEIGDRLMNPFAHRLTFAVTGLFGIALTLGYVALHAVIDDRE